MKGALDLIFLALVGFVGLTAATGLVLMCVDLWRTLFEDLAMWWRNR